MPLRHVKDVHGLSVLFVMAAEPEYGPHLKARIDPLITGVGPVEAAAATAHALADLRAAARTPDLVLSLGSAGSRVLEHAGVYQISRLSYRDMDASALGFAKGVTPFLDHPPEIEVAPQIPGLAAATLSTGANIVSGKGYDAVAAEMVDMESFAVHRAAARFGVAMIGLRGISDGRADLTGLHDWTDYLHLVDERLAAALDHLAACVADGRFGVR